METLDVHLSMDHRPSGLGDSINRRLMMWGRKFIKAWSKTMDIIALSTGESELGAVVTGATEGLGLQSLL